MKEFIYDPIAEWEEQEHLRVMVRVVLAKICDREQLMLQMRFGIDEPELSISEIADMFGLLAYHTGRLIAKSLDNFAKWWKRYAAVGSRG